MFVGAYGAVASTNTAPRAPEQVLTPWSDAETLLWGGFSGAMAGLFTTPFDVIKTRIMTSESPGAGRARLRSSESFRVSCLRREACHFVSDA